MWIILAQLLGMGLNAVIRVIFCGGFLSRRETGCMQNILHTHQEKAI